MSGYFLLRGDPGVALAARAAARACGGPGRPPRTREEVTADWAASPATARQVAARIAAELAPFPGARLAPVRQIAAHCGVDPATARAARRLLRDAGIIFCRDDNRCYAAADLEAVPVPGSRGAVTGAPRAPLEPPGDPGRTSSGLPCPGTGYQDREAVPGRSPRVAGDSPAYLRKASPPAPSPLEEATA